MTTSGDSPAHQQLNMQHRDGRQHFFLAVRCLGAVLGLAAGVQADEIRLTTGETLSGVVVKKAGDQLVLKNKALGDVSIPWAAIAAVRSDSALAVQFADGRSVIGRVSTTDSGLQITTGTTTVSGALKDVSTIRTAEDQQRLEHPGVSELWSGYGQFGYAMARGNARTNIITTALNASRTTLADKITAYFNQLYGAARANGVVSTNANAIRGGWSYTRNLTSRLTANAINDYAFDEFQDLDLRAVIGGGLGYVVYKSDTSRLDLLAGFDYNREKFGTGLVRNSAEAFVGNDWTYRLATGTNLTESFRIFPNLTQTGEYRMNFDFGVATNIRKWLAFHLTVSDRFLSNPLPTFQRNDLLLTTGIRVNFGQK